MNKLEGLPPIHYVSIEESLDRRENLHKHFREYSITNIVPHIFKRFSEYNHQLVGRLIPDLPEFSKGPLTSHLCLLKEWCQSPYEPYILVFEDDISFETVKYWNFTWKEFEKNLPDNWNCIQLSIIKKDSYEDCSFKIRDPFDWSGAAYLIRREYAELLVESYYKEDIFTLDIKDTLYYPILENILFCEQEGIYSFPLFVTDLFNTTSTTVIPGLEEFIDLKFEPDTAATYVYHSYISALLWWSQIGKKLTIEQIMKKNSTESQIQGENFQLYTSNDLNICNNTMLNELIDFSLDTENDEKNYNLAEWYEKQGHTAAAHTYYLRSAERTENKLLGYKALIRASFCYKLQGSRDETQKILLENALNYFPERPEAYYFLSLIYEKRNEWQNCYTYANLGLNQYKNNLEDLSIKEYPGKFCLIFQKAVSGWCWGKNKECRDLFKELYDDYWEVMDKDHQNLVLDNMKKLNVSYEKKDLKQIPVIGVPIVNGVHWLRRLIDSIDYPVKDFFIINNNGKDEITEELNQLVNIKNNFIEKIKVCHLPSNLGVADSWNLIIKSYMMEPYWIICSNDVSFTPGLLKEMVEKSKNEEVGIVQPNGHKGLGSYEFFLLKDFVVEKCGLFDENLYPAYSEDVDYILKAKKHNIKKMFLESPFFHGETQNYSETGSQTWRLNLDIKEKVDTVHWLNKEKYLTEKWGENYEKYLHNDNNLTPIEKNNTSYNLNFNRQKYLGF
jgi:hypothetical protein